MRDESQADRTIEELRAIFELATTGFEEFYSSADKSSGYYSTAASSGNYSRAASSGYSSTAASSGNYSTAASSGNYSTAASSGNSSTAASSGNYSTAASSGYYSTAASSGYYSTAASSGNYSTAASSGNYSACVAVGYRAAVKGDLGNLLMASEYDKANKHIPIGGKADLVDGVKLKPQCWYIVENNEWVEVDFTDNLFSYVLSTKRGVKKVKTENGDALFIVTDDKGNSAHGKSIKEARQDLIYKAVASFDGKLPSKATGTEWIGIYRAVTGACAAGVRQFVEQSKASIDATYTAAQIAKMVTGHFGAEAFSAKVKES